MECMEVKWGGQVGALFASPKPSKEKPPEQLLEMEEETDISPLFTKPWKCKSRCFHEKEGEHAERINGGE